MALIKCPECSRNISDKAESCPQCGLPLTAILHEPSTTNIVTCLDCKKEFDLDAEICPHCGLFNSQKYNNIESSALKELTDVCYKSSCTTNNISNTNVFIPTLVVSLFISLIIFAATGSALIGIITFIICIAAMTRVKYLAKHPDKKLKYERHIYTWKSILAYCLLIIIIVAIQSRVSAHADKVKQELAAQATAKSNSDHLVQAKLLLAKAPNLSDNEWTSVNNHLDAITADAVERPEASKLLPTIKNKMDEITKRKREEQKRQDKIKEQERFQQETAGLNAKGKRLKEKHPEWSVDDCDTISKGKVRVGMTTAQVAAAWGRPYNINRTHNAYGSSEQWVMHEYGSTYVYFEDGICTTIQN